MSTTTSSAGRPAGPGTTPVPGSAVAAGTAPTEAAARATVGVESTARSMAEAAAEPASGITGAQSLVRALEAVGCGSAQGFLLSRPIPLAVLLELLEEGAGHLRSSIAGRV